VATASLAGPTGVALDSLGRVFITDERNCLIRMVYNGKVTTEAGSPFCGDAEGPRLSAAFGSPVDLAVDTSGWIYIVDEKNHDIKVLRLP
jgi:hypothetical protein